MKCAWVNDLSASSLQNDPSEPQANVSWCDAYFYCQWAGKRLCGSRDGGTLPWNTPVNDPSDAWHHACSDNGTRAYAYGSTWSSTTCNDDGNGSGVVAVATFPQCVGGFPGLYDMTGNAMEWIDSCSGTAAHDDQCRALGGDYSKDKNNSTCASTRRIPRPPPPAIALMSTG